MYAYFVLKALKDNLYKATSQPILGWIGKIKSLETLIS